MLRVGSDEVGFTWTCGCARRCEVGGRKWLCFSPREEKYGNDCVDVPGQSEVEKLLLGWSGGESDGPVWSEMICLVKF